MSDQHEEPSNLEEPSVRTPDPMAGMSQRSLKPSEWEQWIRDYNPYPENSIQYHVWGMIFLGDQIEAMRDPKRSRRAWISKYVAWPVIFISLGVQVAIGIWVTVKGS